MLKDRVYSPMLIMNNGLYYLLTVTIVLIGCHLVNQNIRQSTYRVVSCWKASTILK